MKITTKDMAYHIDRETDRDSITLNNDRAVKLFKMVMLNMGFKDLGAFSGHLTCYMAETTGNVFRALATIGDGTYDISVKETEEVTTLLTVEFINKHVERILGENKVVSMRGSPIYS